MRWKHIYFLMSLVVTLFPLSSLAQGNLCGDPPQFTLTQQETEKLKGDVEGTASFLKGFVGGADLGGKIISERQKFYQTDPAIVAQQKDAYLYYVMCAFLLNDKTMSTPQKLEELRKTKESFDQKVGDAGQPKSAAEILKAVKFNVTSFAYVKAQLGVPTNEDDTQARYDIAGYVVLIQHHSAAEQSSISFAKEAIHTLMFITNRDADDGQRNLTIDGTWNDVSCEKDIAGNSPGACGPIVTPVGLGLRTVKDYVRLPDRCTPGRTTVSKEWFPFYTLLCQNDHGGPWFKLYLRSQPDEILAAGADPDAIATLFQDKPTPPPTDGAPKFSPPKPVPIEEQFAVREKQTFALQNLLVTRLEVGNEIFDPNDDLFYNELFP